MTTTPAIEPAAAATAATAIPPKSQALVAGQVPWVVDDEDLPLPVKRAVRAETVHWSVIALTLVTAASILFAAHASRTPRPPEPAFVISVAP